MYVELSYVQNVPDIVLGPVEITNRNEDSQEGSAVSGFFILRFIKLLRTKNEYSVSSLTVTSLIQLINNSLQKCVPTGVLGTVGCQKYITLIH